jgi:hypothetical protein
MVEFALIDVKVSLVSFVANAVLAFLADDHLAALHVVIHDILQLWHVILKFHAVKVDVLQSRQLKAVCVLNIVDLSSAVYCVVLHPDHFVQKNVMLTFEKLKLA